MAFIHNITTVARYEARTLRRSWFFRLFSIGAIIILTFMNIGIFSPLGDEGWHMISIPSTLPLMNLYLLNIGQAVVIVFLASDFMRRDKKLDTNEVLYTRSMSNFEYVTGKTIGILRLFISLDLIILAIGLIINIISKRMSVDILSYFEYLLVLILPTIIFSLGLSFVSMLVIRNQAITFLILLGYAALDMFWLWHRAGHVFDYMAFGVPVFKSGIIGFDNPWLLWNQRLIYFTLGLSLIFASILLFRRLPQSKPQTTLAATLMIIFFGGFCVTLFNTLLVYKKAEDTRLLAIETNRKYEDRLFPSITDASLEVLHKGSTIEVKAVLKFLNDNTGNLDHYLFSLNPSLKVREIKTGEKLPEYRTFGHIIEITPAKPLEPGRYDSITIFYSGRINESFCYPGYKDNIKEYPYRINMLNVAKRQSFLQDDFVLLTPETQWYPVSGLNYYPSNPARIKVDFTRFNLKAKSEKGLVAVSQGKPGMDTDGSYIYSSDIPLTGMTLAMGNYLCDSIKVDSVDFYSWHYKGSDYYKKDLLLLKDTLRYLVSGFMTDLETSFATRYPFRTFTITEVPVQFHSFPKRNTQTRAELQPSMIIVPEKLSTIERSGFGKLISRQKRNTERNNLVITEKEMQVRMFNAFVRNTFISGENFRFRNGIAENEPERFRLGPSFYFFRNNFYSTGYPVINSVFESHLQKATTPGRPQGPVGMTGNMSDNDRANIILRNVSFRDMLAKNPGSDTLSLVLTVKGDFLFNLLRKYAGIDEFKTWFKEYLDSHKFRRVDIFKLNTDIKEEFGFEFYPYLENWFNGTGQPGFIFSDPEAREIIVDDRTRFMASFVVSNPEPEGGLFNISFRTGGPGGGQMMMAMMQRGGGGGGRAGGGGGGGGQRGGGARIQMAMQGRGMEASDIDGVIYVGPSEAKKITRILDNPPRAMIINTLFSKNLPGEINIPFDNLIRTREKTDATETEEILEKIPALSEPDEVIVDNEDPGFLNTKKREGNNLKKILGVKMDDEETYGTITLFSTPDYWKPIIQTNFYGKYVRSAVYTRAGTGDRSVTWQGIIKQPGYYDVYVYIGKAGQRIMFRQEGRPAGGGPGGGMPEGQGMPQMDERRDNPFKDLHYRVYHDDGEDEVILEWETAEPEWNKIGTYYFSPDTVKVTLTNLTEGRTVVGDAVKWVLQK